MEIPTYFNRFISAIQPSEPSRTRAIQLHTTLVKRLRAHEEFTKILDVSFLYGSYRRNTALNPIKDVDVCTILDIDYKRYTPERIVDYLREVLEAIGYEDKTAHQQRSIRIDMSQTTLDVVPVVVETDADEPLRIPDQLLNQWIHTHPKAHLAEATRLNAISAGRYLPLVKIVKSWYKYQCRGQERPKPKGFTLESLVAQYQEPDSPSYAEAFVGFLSSYWAACGERLKRGIFPPVPDPGMPGEFLALTFSVDEAKAFGAIVEASLMDARAALALEGDVRDSAIAWRNILGPKFPTEPLGIVKSMAEATFDSTEDEPIENAMSIDLPQATGFAPFRLTIGVAPSVNGTVTQMYESNGEPLPKNRGLFFTIVDAPVRPPFTVTWTVTNHGTEATRAKALTHFTRGASTTQWESTSYRGSHWMTCDIEKNGVLVARQRVIINIT